MSTSVTAGRMAPGEVLGLFDRYQRREVGGNVVRQINKAGGTSMTLLSNLDSAEIDDAIEAEIAYFSRLSHELE